jgi:hypothetical protein
MTQGLRYRLFADAARSYTGDLLTLTTGAEIKYQEKVYITPARERRLWSSVVLAHRRLSVHIKILLDKIMRPWNFQKIR